MIKLEIIKNPNEDWKVKMYKSKLTSCVLRPLRVIDTVSIKIEITKTISRLINVIKFNLNKDVTITNYPTEL